MPNSRYAVRGLEGLEMGVPVVRRAERGDAGRLALLAERTFRDTFGPENTTENMDAHCRDNFSEDIQGQQITDPASVTLLSEVHGAAVGFAQVRWGPAPNCVRADAPGEIQRLYVSRDWHCKGVAQGLMAGCMEELKRHGSDVVWLGVWERNPRAIAFYRKFGFVEVGEHVFRLGDDLQRDVVMARPALTSAGVERDGSGGS